MNNKKSHICSYYFWSSFLCVDLYFHLVLFSSLHKQLFKKTNKWNTSLVMHFCWWWILWVFLCQKIKIFSLPSFLKDIFIGYSIQGWLFFSFSTLEMLLLCLLVWIFPTRNPLSSLFLFHSMKSDYFLWLLFKLSITDFELLYCDVP